MNYQKDRNNMENDVQVQETEMEEKIPIERIGSSGIPIPKNWKGLSYTQRKIYLNYDKPPLGPVYYSLLFKNGNIRFANSNAKSNFNLQTMERDLFNAWPNLEKVIFYDTKEEFLNYKKGITNVN